MWRNLSYYLCDFICVAWRRSRREVAEAHPYASGVTNQSGTVSYFLNEAADDVKVAFDGGSVTNGFGGLGAGAHSFGLGGHTNFLIIVAKAGSGAPSQISVDSPLTTFHAARGVAVNRNPRTRNFGRTYVANATPGTEAARATQKGVYALNADQSDAFDYGATAYPPPGAGVNQIQYGSSANYAPDKVSVGPDDSVYIADASGATGSGFSVGGGVWMAGADLAAATDLFAFNGTTAGPGLVCVAGTPVVFGAAATSNLVLYTVEWNRTPYNNIWQYQIDEGPLPFGGAPTQLGSAGIPGVNQVLADLCVAPDGKFFTCEHRTSATSGNVSVRVFDFDGVTPLWESATAGNGNDPFVNSYGVAVSPDDRFVATGVGSGMVDLCQLTNGIPDLTTFRTVATGLAGICQGVAWDAADNLYAVGGATSGNNVLRVFSLGLASVCVTSGDATGTNGAFQSFISNAPPPVVLPPVFPTGWSQFANSPGPNNMRHDDIYFADPVHGWASQNNYIYRTTNGGSNWTTNLYLPGTHFRSVAFATPQVGFAGNLGMGSYDGGASNTNVLYATTDGGVTWANVPGLAEAGMKGLCSIFVLDAEHIYGAGRVRGPAYFIKSTNGGAAWSVSSLTAANVMNGIMDVYFADPTNGWVVGMDMNIYTNPPYYGASPARRMGATHGCRW